ncbi:MAG: DUF885 family protein, partial [Armatimonadetes bacterium]|nr:DUF885 family protein [Armatimonadota bacterium]
MRTESLSALLEEVFRREERASPVTATALGVHAYDNLIDDMRREAILSRAADARTFLRRLEAIDAAALSLAEHIDRREVQRHLRAIIRSIEGLRHWERSPGLYAGLAVRSVHLLLLREFAPLEQRLHAALNRLKEVPRVLAEGRINVQRAPRVFVDTALASIRGGVGFFGSVVPQVAAQSPGLQAEVTAAAQAAAVALEAYADHLQTGVAVTEDGFAIGAPLFTEILQDGHLLPYDAESLYEEGRRLFGQTLADLGAAARRI